MVLKSTIQSFREKCNPYPHKTVKLVNKYDDQHGRISLKSVSGTCIVPVPIALMGLKTHTIGKK